MMLLVMMMVLVMLMVFVMMVRVLRNKDYKSQVKKANE